MVFESVVTDLINKILGNYVVNLDKKQLKIGIWGGDVSLNSLKVRENALDELNLPIQLVHGYIGKLVLKIPWQNIYSQPVVAQIEDFYVLISPRQSVEYNAEKEEELEFQTKLAKLQAFDEAYLRELSKDLPKPDASFIEKLTAQIVNNLQVKIANVHIRYEDTSTTGKPFAFGVTLHQLELYTTDKNWIKSYLTEQVTRVYKIANLEYLAAYMNCNTTLFSSYTESEINAMLREDVAREELLPTTYNYVVGPLSSHAKLRLNMNPEYDEPAFEIPKIDLKVEMQTLNIGLTSTQFQDILKLADSMNRMQLGAPYRKYRPFNTPYKNHYKEWWTFAIKSVLEENVRKQNRYWSWKYMKEHRQLCNTYAVKLKEKSTAKKPSANLIETCTLLEKKLDIFNLVLIRKRIQYELAKQKDEMEKQASQQRWFSGWFGSSKSTAESEQNDIVKQFENAMTPAEKAKLYEAIGYEENGVPQLVPEEYEAIQMNFVLVALKIGLYDDSKEQKRATNKSIDFATLQTIMLLKFSMATAVVKQRPGANALSVTAYMKEMRLTGLEKTLFQPPPTMIESKLIDEHNLLDIFFETNPLDKKCDQRIRVHARPLQITYDSSTILHLMTVFSPAKSVNLSEIEDAATQQMADFKERSATGMQYIIETRSVIEFDIQFMPNVLIIPHSGTFEAGKTALIVISLGQLHITSAPHKNISTDVATLFETGTSRDIIMQNIMDKAYDLYTISLEDIQIMIAKPHEDWESVLRLNSVSEMHVLRPTSVLIKAELCVLDDDPRLPKTKIEIELPSIHVNLTEDRIYEALGVLTSVPLPNNDTSETPTLVKAIGSASSILSVGNLFQETRKTKERFTSDLDAEIIQYTTLEVNFALKEVLVTLYKTSCIKGEKCYEDGDESLLEESENYATPRASLSPVDREGIKGHPQTMNSLSQQSSNVQKILTLQTLQLEMEMSQRTYELVVDVRLGAINITQYEQLEQEELIFKIIDTPRYSKELKYLLTVSYIMAEKNSPEFITKYNSTEQFISVNFSTLQATAHQEGLLHLLEISDTFTRKMAAMRRSSMPSDRVASAADPGVLNKLATISESSEAFIKPTAKRKRRQTTSVVESIKVNVIINLEKVGLLLTCRKRSIASMGVDNFKAGVVLKSSYTEITLLLKDIIVIDLNPLTIHPDILTIVGKNALNCQLVLYNLDETSDYNSDDMKITVEIGCVKVIFLNWFVTSVLRFLNNFQAAQQAIADASAAAADAARQNAFEAYKKATRMKLNIKLKAPVIVVPIDSQNLNAIVLDLGHLKLSNAMKLVTVKNNERSPAIIEDLQLELRNFKLAKCTIEQDVDISLSGSIDTVDQFYGLKSDMNIVDPMNLTVNVKRNLSSSWYFGEPEMDISGRLKSIQLNLFMEDYSVIMSILNRNLSEGLDEFPVVRTHPKPDQTVADVHLTAPAAGVKNVEEKTVKSNKAGTAKTTKSDKEPKKGTEQLKFNFQFDGIVANLRLGNNEDLARFGLYFLSVKGSKMENGTITTSIVLCNIQIDDKRSNVKSNIKQYLCRKEWNPTEAVDLSPTAISKSSCATSPIHMLDVTVIILGNDTFAEIRVFGFDLILCIDFLMQIANFFKLPEDDTVDDNLNKTDVKVSGQKALPKANTSKAVEPPPEDKKTLELILIVEEPDIILVESLEDDDTNAIIFNTRANLNYRSIDDNQIVNGEINALKMYMCAFMPERREATRHYIIHPCTLTLHGTTPDRGGLNVALHVSDIIINISPATIELFNKALRTINAGSTEKIIKKQAEVTYEKLWAMTSFRDSDYWFIKADEAEDALESTGARESRINRGLVKCRSDRCVLEVPSILIVIESGVGYYTTPLLNIESTLTATICDWSDNMNIVGYMSLHMNYFNQTNAVWEPLIEMNEHITKSGMRKYLPWGLNFALGIESKKNEFDEDVEETTTKIKIQSDYVLELTVSKTCLDLLGVLGEAFSQAIDDKGLTKPDIIAAYMVENDTGFDITLNLWRGTFTLHDCHIPTPSKSPNALNRCLVFESAGIENKVAANRIRECKVSPGGRVYLQTKDVSTVSVITQDEFKLFVTVGAIKKEIVLPVSRSDKRYFALYRDTNQDSWGIISEVRSEYGTTIINIHGVVNIHNHFTTEIHIFRQRSHSNEKLAVGVVAPGQVFHVPLHAIYAEFKDLYFSLNGYKVSVQGIKWNDSPTDLSYNRHIQCDPIETFEPFNIVAVREKTEVCYELTDKYKLLSAYFTIHLRPPVFLRNALPIAITVSVAGCSVKTEDRNVSSVDMPKVISKEDLLDYGEKQIDPGDALLLPTVKLGGKNKAKSHLVIRLIQYLEKDWCCTTEISATEKNIVMWHFTSYDSTVSMQMDLYVRCEYIDSSLMVTLFSPFWMINKTGLMLSYKTDRTECLDELYHPPEYNGPVLFSFTEKFFFDKKRASIRVDNGEWSSRIPLDVAGSAGSVSCKANEMIYEIGVHNSLTHNSLTKQITFIPFYTMTNKCEFRIELQEKSRPADDWQSVEPNSCMALWPRSDSDHMIIARVMDQETVPFDYTEVQCTLLKLINNRYGGINVDVQTTEGGVYVTFSPYNPGDAPGCFINHTSKPVVYREKGTTVDKLVQPHQKVLFTWFDPAGERILVLGQNRTHTDLRRDDIGNLTLPDGGKAFWVSFLDGLQRVLLFTEVEAIARRSETSATMQSITQSIEVRIHGIGLSLINNETGVDILYLGITSSGIIWEQKRENKKRFKQMNIHETRVLENEYQKYLNDIALNKTDQIYTLDNKTLIDFDNMTMMKSATSKRCLQRTFYPGIWIMKKSSPYQTQLHAKINRIQIDNQLDDCIFRVVLAPIPPPKSVATTTVLKPFIECSIVERVVPNSTVKQIKYAGILMQEFHFKVDLLFLTAIANLFTTSTNEEKAAKLFAENVQYIEKPLIELVQTHSLQEQKNFYDNLHLGPIKIHLSFSMAGSDTTALPALLATLVQGVGVTLTDVNDVVFRLAFFEREFRFFTQRQLVSEISDHYTGQALKQLYVLVLGLDVLGNPYGLVVGLKKGVEDLFYEPFQGAIQGPGEFAEGLVLGVKSLFGHTVGGAANAVSKITGAMGQGFAALTFDEDYQKKRRENLNKRPNNLQEGIARGGKGLVMGFVDGVTGVVSKPVSGAKEEGVEGFFKGLGKGAIGLVTRPITGVVDCASSSFGAVKRATESHDEAKRLRPPRYVHRDNVLRMYCHAEAQGNKMLKDLEKGRYASTDSFVHCEEIVRDQEYVILSNYRIIYASKSDLFGNFTVRWTHLWNEISSMVCSDGGIELRLKKEGKKVMGMFSTHEVQRKFIAVTEQHKRESLETMIESLLTPQ